VPREEAFIPAKLFRILEDVSHKIPVAIITTKDLVFIRKRVPFAHAIAAISGLELQIGSKLFVDKCALRNIGIMSRAYREARRISAMDSEIIVESKTTHEGKLMAFCVDWRMSQKWVEAQRMVRPFLAKYRKLGLYVVESDSHPFADIYTTRVDKHGAFLKLRSRLGLGGPIMYLGDSEFDNPAFELADISVGIKHQGVSPNLLSNYQMEFDDLPVFLSSLRAANFDFVPSMLTKQSYRAD